MVYVRNPAEWRGKDILDRDGDKIGKLEDVYVDVETDEPMFGTVKEGLFVRHLTFVPLGGTAVGPDSLQVTVSKGQAKDAPNIAMEGDELSQADEATLYLHYQLSYTPPGSQRGADSPAAKAAHRATPLAPTDRSADWLQTRSGFRWPRPGRHPGNRRHRDSNHVERSARNHPRRRRALAFGGFAKAGR